MSTRLLAIFGSALLTGAATLFAFQSQAGTTLRKAADNDLDLSASPMRPYIESFSLDRTSLLRYYAMGLDWLDTPPWEPHVKPSGVVEEEIR